MGANRLESWLRNRKVRGCLLYTCIRDRHTAVVGEKVTAQMVHTLAREVMTLNEKIAEVDKVIENRFREHELAPVIASLPGIGPLLGAEFLAATSGDMSFFATPDRLAGFAGLAPAPRTPAVSAATSAARSATIADSNASSIRPPSSASATARSPAGSMTAKERKVSDTPRLCWPWPAAASTSSGHSCGTDGATKLHHLSQHHLDNVIGKSIIATWTMASER